MKIIINHSSMQPIYEQIMEQIKSLVLSGELKEGDLLPSVRSLSKELKISALTVKKSYDSLEEEGYVVTVHGKGSFIAGVNPELFHEESRREVENTLEQAIRLGKKCGMGQQELKELFELIMEDIL